MSIILFVLLSCAVLFSIFAGTRAQKATQVMQRMKQELEGLQGKANQLKNELAQAKEDVLRKSRALDEAREIARKKLRKSAQKEAQLDNELSTLAGDNDETERLKKTCAALELQLKNTLQHAEMMKTQATQVVKEEFESQVRELSESNKKLASELNSIRQTQKQKREHSLGQLQLDAKTLPETAQEELARLLRKAEQHERMHAVAIGKFQLAQERYAELQKRYFAVCRELALAVGQDTNALPEQAQHMAEAIIAASEKNTLS